MTIKLLIPISKIINGKNHACTLDSYCDLKELPVFLSPQTPWSPWIPMGSNRFLWVPMGSDGFLWFSPANACTWGSYLDVVKYPGTGLPPKADVVQRLPHVAARSCSRSFYVACVVLLACLAAGLCLSMMPWPVIVRVLDCIHLRAGIHTLACQNVLECARLRA